MAIRMVTHSSQQLGRPTQAHKGPQLGIVTGCRTRVPVAAVYSRVRVRVGFIQPRPYPYPQPGVGGSAHIFKLRAKSTQTMPDASFGPYVGMFSSFFFAFFSKLTHSFIEITGAGLLYRIPRIHYHLW